MKSDRQLVSAKHLLSALREYERLGATQALQRLEAAEPDLIEHVLEALSRLNSDLFESGVAPRVSRRIVRRVESMALVAIAALQAAHAELWSDVEPHKSDEPQSRDDESSGSPA